MTDAWRDDYGYYDGPLSGVLFDGDNFWYYLMSETSSLYPAENHPEGRLYDVWALDEEPTEEQANDVWWRPVGPPLYTWTEDHLYQAPRRF